MNPRPKDLHVRIAKDDAERVHVTLVGLREQSTFAHELVKLGNLPVACDAFAVGLRHLPYGFGDLPVHDQILRTPCDVGRAAVELIQLRCFEAQGMRCEVDDGVATFQPCVKGKGLYAICCVSAEAWRVRYDVAISRSDAPCGLTDYKAGRHALLLQNALRQQGVKHAIGTRVSARAGRQLLQRCCQSLNHTQIRRDLSLETVFHFFDSCEEAQRKANTLAQYVGDGRGINAKNERILAQIAGRGQARCRGVLETQLFLLGVSRPLKTRL